MQLCSYYDSCRIEIILSISLDVALLFSKIKPKATILGIVALVIVVLVMYFMPVLGFILAFLAFLPGIILWHQSVQSFGIMALVTMVLTTLTGSLFLMTFMIIVLAISAIIGNLLKKRASKERILYISTFVTSLFILIAMMILQAVQRIPYANELLAPYQNAVNQTIQIQNLDTQAQEVLQASVEQLAIQMPGFIIIAVALFMFVSLLINFPILRRFKIATPVFRPLYFWQMKRSIFIIYALSLLVGIMTEPGTTTNSISVNFQLVLGFLIVIQGLSFIHFFAMMKRMPEAVSVILVILGILFYPLTRLIGLLDLGLNLKSMIKNDKR